MEQINTNTLFKHLLSERMASFIENLKEDYVIISYNYVIGTEIMVEDKIPFPIYNFEVTIMINDIEQKWSFMVKSSDYPAFSDGAVGYNVAQNITVTINDKSMSLFSMKDSEYGYFSFMHESFIEDVYDHISGESDHIFEFLGYKEIENEKDIMDEIMDIVCSFGSEFSSIYPTLYHLKCLSEEY